MKRLCESYTVVVHVFVEVVVRSPFVLSVFVLYVLHLTVPVVLKLLNSGS